MSDRVLSSAKAKHHIGIKARSVSNENVKLSNRALTELYGSMQKFYAGYSSYSESEQPSSISSPRNRQSSGPEASLTCTMDRLQLSIVVQPNNQQYNVTNTNAMQFLAQQ
ncbi:hypothetical protein RB195_011025 [Necator americanus]|uniref:Uncharacterized protein n=1 Tax=Necator americanus TaxID=51031 RepID=A0ABR1D2S9_NECAM